MRHKSRWYPKLISQGRWYHKLRSRCRWSHKLRSRSRWYYKLRSSFVQTPYLYLPFFTIRSHLLLFLSFLPQIPPSPIPLRPFFFLPPLINASFLPLLLFTCLSLSHFHTFSSSPPHTYPSLSLLPLPYLSCSSLEKKEL